jgi:hypothetical protein
MPESSSIRRHLLGISGLVLMIVGAAGWVMEPTGAAAAFGQGVLLKVGIVLGLFWLAYPQVVRFPRWLAGAIFMTGIALAVRPRAVAALARASLLLVPILPIVWLLRPRPHVRRTAQRPRTGPADPPHR